MNGYFKTVIKECISDELERGREMSALAALISEAMNEAEAAHKEYQKQLVHEERIDLVKDILTKSIELILTYEDELSADTIQEIKRVKLTDEELESNLRQVEKALKSYSKIIAGIAGPAMKVTSTPKSVKVDLNANKDNFDPDAILRKWANGLN